MSNLFGKLTTTGLEESTDRLGGGFILDSGIYKGTVKALYAGASAGGAMAVSLIADLGNQEYKETFYVTNKNGENFWVNDSKKKVPLPGFTVVDDICLITTGEPLAAQQTEEKVINVYDFDAKKDVPKAVPMLMDAVGKPIALAILRQTVNKRVKQGEQYVETADSRDENVIDKVFHPEYRVTVAEARNNQTEPKFWDAWAAKNTGVTKDKRKVKDGQGGSSAPPKPGIPPAAGQPARKSLFGK